MKPEDFEKIVLAISRIDQMFPRLQPGVDERVVAYQMKVTKVLIEGSKLLQKLQSEQS
jgi:hypothetical protein